MFLRKQVRHFFIHLFSMCISQMNVWNLSFFLKNLVVENMQCCNRWVDEHTLCHIPLIPISDCVILLCTGEGRVRQWKCQLLLFYCVAQVSEKSWAYYWIVSLWKKTTRETEFKVCSHICFSTHNVWIIHLAVRETAEFIY